jgi:hypothetical protein
LNYSAECCSEREVQKSMQRQMNFTNIDTLSLPLLPLLNRICSRLGVAPPHWRHTSTIRRTFRLLGMDV